MNILFIYRDKNFYKHNFNNIFEKNLCKMDFGFLLLSLKTIANVELKSLPEFISSKSTFEYDHVIIDSKIRVDYDETIYIQHFKKNIQCNVSIFLAYDRPFKFEDIFYFEKFLKVTSYFVPNLSKNFDNYNLSSDLKEKIFSTHYGLGFMNVAYDFVKKKFNFSGISDSYNSNVFYSGEKGEGKEIRTKIVEDLIKDKTINNKNINLYDRNDRITKILKPSQYVEETQKSKINLVLAGNQNNITYRLYEVLFLKAFFLVDPHFTNFRISENFDNISEFVFYNYNDLTSKIHFYLENYEKAISIKNQQAMIFENIYNPFKHGDYLQKIINYHQ